MRLIAEKSESYIQALASTLVKDPASLEFWRCLHVKYKSPDSLKRPVHWNQLLSLVQEEFKHVSCDVVVSVDNELLIIGQLNQLDGIYKLQEQLFAKLGEKAQEMEWQLHDLFYGWSEVRGILLPMLKETPWSKHYDDDADFGETHSLTEIFASAKQRQRAREPLHILLVEDDELTRRLVSNLFKEHYAVFTAQTAQEALMQYFLHAPDIVFLDINLPDHDGFKVLKKIITHDPGAYVVMFSGNSYLDNITHALNAGASGFVSKPFSKDKMKHYIDDCAMARQGK